ncbi:MAG: 2OG-Fe(II) oxygenase [Rhizobiaceae bacterium]|nr:2OG-Fe(II) oxygenase [Rhizobiaceae bacterium]
MPNHASILPGDTAPWFHQRSFANPRYAFNTAGGRYIVLCFFGSAGDPRAQAALAAMKALPVFDDAQASFFGVSFDAADEREGRVADSYPGTRFLFDFDGTVGKLYGAIASDETLTPGAKFAIRRLWVVLDPTMRVMKTMAFADDGSDIAEMADYLAALPPVNRFAGFELQAPILFLPDIFEPGFCDTLIAQYDASGGEDSGFMREVNGKTVLLKDSGHKVRRDHTIEESATIEAVRSRFVRRVVPQIKKAYNFEVTRMERYLVGCYAAEDAAHFRAHRDNTTSGTAHRRFAVSVNLNADFDGGEVSFPEFGSRSYKAPVGGAVVFSCSLLHAVSRVTRGRRYAFLPFLYDDAAAKVRHANLKSLDAATPPA